MEARQSLTLDFNKAVQMVRQHFPAETTNITFVDLSGVDAQRDISAFYQSLPQHAREKLFLKYGLSSGDDLYSQYKDSGGFALKIPDTPLMILGAHTDPKQRYFFADPVKEALQTFLHELGHLIVPNGSVSAGPDATREERNRAYNMGENAADVFATLYMRMLGFLNHEDIENMSSQRAFAAWYGLDVVHTTSFALDNVHIRISDANVTSLTPGMIKQIAEAAAEHMTPDETTLNNAMLTLHPISPQSHAERARAGDPKIVMQECVQGLVDVCSLLPETSYIRAISMKALQRAAVVGAFNPTEPQWAEARQLLSTMQRKTTGFRPPTQG